MNMLQIFNKLSSEEILTKHVSVFGSILGGLATLPPGKVELGGLREHFNQAAMNTINVILNPLVELAPGLDIHGIVESAYKTYTLRYLAVYDFGMLLLPNVTMCELMHTADCHWVSTVYDQLNQYLNPVQDVEENA